MFENVNDNTITEKYLCDVCKTKFLRKGNEISPLHQVHIPIKRADTDGELLGVFVERVWICPECLLQFERDISNLYDMQCIENVGIAIKRR